MRRLLVACLPMVCLVLGTAGCGLSARAAAPECGDAERTATVAQSVPTAAYVPCLGELPPGWQVTDVDIRTGGARLALLSDRSDGEPVEVTLTESCDTAGATPSTARAPGVRSALLLDGIGPRYAGTAIDVFPGGCLQTSFAFPRGRHVLLMEELAAAVELVPRRQLRAEVREELGVELDP